MNIKEKIGILGISLVFLAITYYGTIALLGGF
jgi:hypothetical protein